MQADFWPGGWRRDSRQGGKSPHLHLVVCLFAVVLPARRGAAEHRQALLVGCSQYPNHPRLKVNPLPGTENDARLYAELLRSRYEFQDIVTLTGWPDDQDQRPTRANICRGFERLIARATAGSQVMIVLSGHGTQFDVPKTQANLLDPTNPEPDGLDEVFLPADYAGAQDAIRDDQFGDWLDQLQAKGSHVWIVFDCCFSGGLARGPQELVRTVPAHVLGIDNRRAEPVNEAAAIGLVGETPASGSVVAFYASQSFETAKEVLRPRGAEGDEHRHGLLSYHLTQALQQRAALTTYGELARELISRIRADMGHGGPTPSFEGDLTFEIWGLERWPEPDLLVLEKSGDTVRLAGGEIAGITTGTILAVFAPDDAGHERVLGHVEATEVTATDAAIKSVAVDPQRPATPVEEFPDLSRCQIISRELGNLAVSIASDTPVHDEQLAEILQALEGIDYVNVLSEGEQAAWIVATVSDAATQAKHAVLRESESGKIYAKYPLTAPQSAAKRLQEDLRRIFTWNNLWRLAHEYASVGTQQTVTLEVAKIRGPQDFTEGQLLQTGQLRAGEHVLTRVVNRGYLDRGKMNFAVLFLGPHFEIDVVRYGSIRGRELHDQPIKQPVDRMRIGPVAGKAGYVVIASRLVDHPHAWNYSFLQQGPVGVPTAREAPQIPEQLTAFEQLLLTASEGKPRLRAALNAPAQPDVASWSWTIVSDEVVR